MTYYGKVDYPERPCSICEAEFKPKTIRSIVCEAEDCKRKRYRSYQREYHREYHKVRMEDPKYRERKNEYQREYHIEKSKDPKYMEKMREYRKKRYHGSKE